MNIKQALGARIKELRHKQGYTQEEFAEIINVAPRHISRIENGVNTPSIETLDRIAHVFNVEMKDLCSFQHLSDETTLREDISKILAELKRDELVLVHKILNAMFR